VKGSPNSFIDELMAAGRLPVLALEANLALARTISEAVEGSPRSDGGAAVRLVDLLSLARSGPAAKINVDARSSASRAVTTHSINSLSEYVRELVARCEDSTERYRDKRFIYDAPQIIDSALTLLRLSCAFQIVNLSPDHYLKASALCEIALSMIFQAVTIGTLDVVGDIPRARRERQTEAATIGRVAAQRSLLRKYDGLARKLLTESPTSKPGTIIDRLRKKAAAESGDPEADRISSPDPKKDEAMRARFRRAFEPFLKELKAQRRTQRP
jgi:hypothetical protein